MLQAAQNAIRIADGRTRADLDSDLSFGLALWKLLEIVGEAAGRVTPGLRAGNPQVAWQLAIDMRNRLTHGYDTVNYAVVWKTVRKDLPVLVPHLQSILAELDRTQPENN